MFSRIVRTVRRFINIRRGVPLVLAALSVACVYEPEGKQTLRVSSEFSAAEVELIQRAVDELRTATDGGLDVTLTIRDDREAGEWSIRPGALSPNQIGATGIGQIMIDPPQMTALGAGDVTFVANVMHEVLHAAGLKHETQGLMQPTLEGVPACVDAYTFETICARYECGPQARPTCS
jgi:hypothetical protein